MALKAAWPGVSKKQILSPDERDTKYKIKKIFKKIALVLLKIHNTHIYTNTNIPIFI